MTDDWWELHNSDYISWDNQYDRPKADSLMALLRDNGVDVMLSNLVTYSRFSGDLYTRHDIMVRIPDLDTIMRIMKATGFPVILFPKDSPKSIEIYDGWRE